MLKTKIIKFQRNGRMLVNKVSGREEEVLDTWIDGKKLARGHCYPYLGRVLGVRFCQGEAKSFSFKELGA